MVNDGEVEEAVWGRCFKILEWNFMGYRSAGAGSCISRSACKSGPQLVNRERGGWRTAGIWTLFNWLRFEPVSDVVSDIYSFGISSPICRAPRLCGVLQRSVEKGNLGLGSTEGDAGFCSVVGAALKKSVGLEVG